MNNYSGNSNIKRSDDLNYTIRNCNSEKTLPFINLAKIYHKNELDNSNKKEYNISSKMQNPEIFKKSVKVDLKEIYIKTPELIPFSADKLYETSYIVKNLNKQISNNISNDKK